MAVLLASSRALELYCTMTIDVCVLAVFWASGCVVVHEGVKLGWVVGQECGAANVAVTSTHACGWQGAYGVGGYDTCPVCSQSG
jgi:hypothetical protein